MAKQISYRMNLDLAGYKEGETWDKGTEPLIVTKWAEQGGGSVKGGQPILTILIDGKPQERKELKTFTVCPKCGYPDDAEIKILCKGKNQDGSPCKFSGDRLADNGYCFKHQDQAPKNDDQSDNLKTEEGTPNS